MTKSTESELVRKLDVTFLYETWSNITQKFK